MSRDRGGDDRSWQTTGRWEGSLEQTRVTQAILAQQYDETEEDNGEQH
jgi:hypothetical protein